MTVNIDDLKKLREKTKAGVSDCREALEESSGDLKKAEEWLRKKGLEKADKKAERQVKDGRVFAYVHHTGKVGSMVGLACETDFVAKTEEFQKLGKELALQVASAQPQSLEELMDQEYIRDPAKKISELVREVIGKLGENIQIVEYKVIVI